MALGESFDEVLEAARVGAEWAWRALYSDTAPDLLRYARANHVSDPEDVVGETFLRAVSHLPSFEGDERGFRAWLFTLARNRIVDEQRKRVRRRTEPLPVEVLAEIGDRGDVESEAMRALAEDRVRSILAHLTPDQREVLMLRILGGLTIDEIATVVRKRPGAVKALQARGIAGIRDRIDRTAVTL
ncbi:MAG TPA: RNA polymerase sigma factor [Actinomycetota bacterium]|nr:RNA polymerase sigma factor [Actinomycetota bacterium]